MVIRAHTHGASVVLFAGIYLADAASFSVGQYCGLLESVYREVEWAVLSNDLFFLCLNLLQSLEVFFYLKFFLFLILKKVIFLTKG